MIVKNGEHRIVSKIILLQINKLINGNDILQITDFENPLFVNKFYESHLLPLIISCISTQKPLKLN